MDDFTKQYKHDKWQKKRLEILRRDKWKCRCCGETNISLDVHHLYYDVGCLIWDYDNEVLVSLCRDCHIKIHVDLKKVSGLIAFKLLCAEIDMIEIDQKIDEIINYF